MSLITYDVSEGNLSVKTSTLSSLPLHEEPGEGLAVTGGTGAGVGLAVTGTGAGDGWFVGLLVEMLVGCYK